MTVLRFVVCVLVGFPGLTATAGAQVTLDLAKITSEDPHAGLPEREDLGSLSGDLQLYDETVAGMDTEWKIAHDPVRHGAF